MVKRITAAVLWFFAAGSGANLIVLATDGPSVAAVAVGVGAAAFVGVDPLHAIWPGTRSASHVALAPDTASEQGLRSGI